MAKRPRFFTISLRSRLLLLTILFVMVVEFFLYVPSIALFRQRFLDERLIAAQIAALSLEETEDNAVSAGLEDELLATAGVVSVIVRRESKSFILGLKAVPQQVDMTFDLRSPSLGGLIMDALAALSAGGERMIRVIGAPILPDSRYLEVTLDERTLYEAMVTQSNNIILLSLVVSLFTGILVYQALHWTVVRPLRTIKKNIIAFGHHPEAAPMSLGKSRRRDEIGVIERELGRMQEEVRRSIQRKAHLAELGEAVAKINHDLRNILATVQLSSNTLERVDHPLVRRVSSRLISAVRRAVALCERTMTHGKAAEPAPDKRDMPLKPLILDVGEGLDLLADRRFDFEVRMPDEFTVYADPEQFHRVFLNLVRNAREVQPDGGQIVTTAEAGPAGDVIIRVADAGPGIPEAARATMFKAFQSAGKDGGSGLGLAVAREIIEAHGGQIMVEETGEKGTVFMITLPDHKKGAL